MSSNNPFTNIKIEFHILQSFPVTCLNRDDVGAPKTAIVGSTTRARVSSQCWKRQVRLEMKNLGIACGTRTKLVAELIKDACLLDGATEEQANNCGNKIASAFIGKKDETPKKKAKTDDEAEEGIDENQETQSNDTLIFLSPNEIKFIVSALKKVGFSPDLLFTKEKKEEQASITKKLANLIKLAKPIDAVDIALFGRMVAKAADMNVEAAASFSHAISTHKISNDVEFFTAIDDLSKEQGSAHMGSLEFNSATYYRYISLDLGQLWKTLGGINLAGAIDAFTKALFVAIPSARQTTQSGASPWEFAKIFVRGGQRLQVPFETAIKAENGGFLQPSIKALKEYLTKKEKLAGSLFAKKSEYTFGEDENFTIDHLISALKQHTEKART